MMTHHHHQQPFTNSSTSPAKLGGRNRGSWKLPLQKLVTASKQSSTQNPPTTNNKSLGKLRNNFLAKPTAPSNENIHTHRRRGSVWVSPTKPFGAVQQQSQQLQPQLKLQPDFGDPTDRLHPTKRAPNLLPCREVPSPSRRFQVG